MALPALPSAIVQRLDAAFAGGQGLVSHAEAARLTELTRAALKKAGDQGMISWRLKGVSPRRWYAREDIEAYWRRTRQGPQESEGLPWLSIDRQNRDRRENGSSRRDITSSTGRSRGRTAEVIVFDAQRARQQKKTQNA